MDAYLYNKERPIMHVDAENGTILEIKEIIKENEHLLPICLQYDSSLKAVNDWMGTRKIPDKREGLKRARQTFRGFENYYNMFSLNSTGCCDIMNL